jgi:predicted HicB family RNase H-like nuclease
LDIDEEAGIIHGRVINAKTVLTFEATSPNELKATFVDTIADYHE